MDNKAIEAAAIASYAEAEGISLPAAEQVWREIMSEPWRNIYRKRARSAITAYLAASGDGWQPIETAPKDGSHILLYRPEIRFVGFWATGGECWVVNAPGLPLLESPTAWRPLPEMPTKAARG